VQVVLVHPEPDVVVAPVPVLVERRQAQQVLRPAWAEPPAAWEA
jgi:hypothetical protein